jgi:hypothetical protein
MLTHAANFWDTSPFLKFVPRHDPGAQSLPIGFAGKYAILAHYGYMELEKLKKERKVLPEQPGSALLRAGDAPKKRVPPTPLRGPQANILESDRKINYLEC